MESPYLKAALLYALLVTALQVEAWSGNFCKRTVCDYVTKRVCAYETWLGCCLYKTIRDPVTRIESYCCDGYTHNGDQNCNIPLCEPGCANGGTCVRPGVCSCRKEFTGPRCDKSQCSQLDPCYPGQCQAASTNCKCTPSFQNIGWERDKRCLAFDKKPEVFRVQAKLSEWNQMKGSWMEIYSILSYSSGQDGADFIWSNRKDFNILLINASGQFAISSLPPKPEYVSRSSFGIVKGEATIQLTKDKIGNSNVRRRRQSQSSNTRYLSLNNTVDCDSKLTYRQPVTTVFQCNLAERLDRSLETGDILTITFSTKSGGFRTLTDLTKGSQHAVQEFEGQVARSSVEFRFDLQAPYHCSELQACSKGEEQLSVKDLTKEPLQIKWGGWRDSLSGINRYALEVFPLHKTEQGSLRILKPLEPQFSKAFMEADIPSLLPVLYTPKDPGMYAIILEAADLANNTLYVRRLTLYDPSSRVTLKPTDLEFHGLHFSSASPAAGFSYQNSSRSALVLTWKDAFRNELHERQGLLGRVEGYPPQLEDYRKDSSGREVFLKTIPSARDDHEGSRTVDEILNRNGIVKFELAYQKLSRVGLSESWPANPPPSVSWKQKNLEETETISEQVNNGDTLLAWVRATDVLGNQLVSRAEVTIDETPAEVGQLQFLMNQHVPGIPFSSTFLLDAKDMESGIAQVRWTFTRKNGTVIYTQTVQGRLAQICRSGDFKNCYCTPRGQCYLTDQSFSLSNCHMIVEKESLAKEEISVQVEVINAAGLVTSRAMIKGGLTMLNGTEAYYPPQNVHLVSRTKTNARVSWNFPPSCYERTDLWVVLPDSRMIPVHKDAEFYDVTGLEAGDEYSIQLIARYSGLVKSEPMVFKFQTEAGLTGGQTAGIVVGILLGLLVLALLALVLVLLVRRREGRDPPAWIKGERFQNWWNQRQMSPVSSGYLDSNMTVPLKPNVQAVPEDLYLTADQTWQEPKPLWQLPATALVLQDQIASGKFADVYRALWTTQDNNKITVAAKIPKPGFGSEDANKMMKKIEFFATKVGKHQHVLNFHGAILENHHLGPVMLLEFCEAGQLDKWLSRTREGTGQSSVSEDTVDKLPHMAADIASGMEFLTKSGIVHTRLAARNVLLTFLLEVKVAGFGPVEVAGDRIPAKWAAPEVLEEKPATEKSDVWAYGVTLWEIFSLGRSPYPDVRGTEMGPYLKSGKRMDKPELADATFYTLMQKCWQAKPQARPSFKDITQELYPLFPPPKHNSGDFYYEASQLRI